MKNFLAVLLCVVFAISLAACGGNSASDTADSNTQPQPVEEAQGQSTEEQQNSNAASNNIDSTTGATSMAGNTDAVTSASIVPDTIVTPYTAGGFTADDDKTKVLLVVGDPRKNSVLYDLVYTAAAFFEQKGLEVELRDLYDIGFNPVLNVESFYNAKDGFGETPQDVQEEQALVTAADHIIFAYPNWHDTPNAITKGYMERVFAKQFAYRDTENGLEGLLTGKSIYTIMNCGYLGGGRGFIGDGVGIDDGLWDSYMRAFQVMDDDTAGFWGVTNKGRFMNDRSPGNTSESYQQDLDALRDALREKLQKDFF